MIVVRRLGRFAAMLFPFRATGVFVIVASFLAFTYLARAKQDLVSLELALLGVGVVALSLLFTLFGAFWVFWRVLRRRSDALVINAEAERKHPSGAKLPLLPWFPLLSLQWSWAEPESVCDIEDGREILTFSHRGEFSKAKRRVEVGDVFGLCQLRFEQRVDVHGKVMPDRGALGRSEALRAFAAGDEFSHPRGAKDGDRVEVREYAPGDPVRLVHWKHFARTRTLMIREHERALMEVRRCAALLVVSRDDEPAAGCARVLIENNSLGDDWLFSTTMHAEWVSSTPEALALLPASKPLDTVGGAQRNRPAPSLRSMIDKAQHNGATSFLFLCEPDLPDGQLNELREAKNRHGFSSRVLVLVDARKTNVGRLRRFFFRQEDERRTIDDHLTHVQRRFSGVGEVRLLDRQSGQMRLAIAPRTRHEVAA